VDTQREVIGTVGSYYGHTHVGLVIVLSLRVTAPMEARSLPFTTVALPTEILTCARMLPWKALLAAPRVAELPTRKKTLHGSTPIRLTDAPAPVVSVDGILNIKTPPPVNVKVIAVEIWADEPTQYVPDVKINPPNSAGAPGKFVVHGLDDSALNAVVRSA
jgi:hypothetical protein